MASSSCVGQSVVAKGFVQSMQFGLVSNVAVPLYDITADESK